MIQPENIMVDFEGHLRLGDFGLCRINLEREEFAHSHCGSPEYMAFETKDSEGYGYPADFYTMGAIIYEMVKGIPPFFKGEPPNYDGTSSGFRDLVQALIR
jgi:serum/glucocorticoid-regulated kinase 2